MKNGKWKVIIFLSMSYLLFLAYAESFLVPFQFDDFPAIINNQTIRSLSLVDIFNFQPTRFTSFFTFALNFHGFEFRPFSFHLVNVLIHAANAMLVYFLTKLVFSSAASAHPLNSSVLRVGAIFTAVIFLCHPIQVQSVTYIVQRITSLSAFFYLSTLVTYLFARRKGDLNGWTRLAVVVLSLLAMTSKENSFTLPFVLVAIEFFILQKSWRQILRKIRAHPEVYLTFLVIPAITYLFGNTQLDHVRNAGTIGAPMEFFRHQPWVLMRYLQIILLQVNQTIDQPVVSVDSWGMAEFWVPAVVLMLLLAFGCLLRRKNPLLSFAIVFFYLTAAVESSFFPLEDLMFEHRMYLPLVGILWCFLVPLLAILNFRLQTVNARFINWIILAMIFCVGMPLAQLSSARNQVWSTAEGLWGEAVRLNPMSERSNINYANALSRVGKLNESIPFYLKALEINNLEPKNYYNLGAAYLRKDLVQEAQEVFQKMLGLFPNEALSFLGLGQTYALQKKWSKAVSFFEKSNEIGGQTRQWLIEPKLVLALLRLGQVDRARHLLEGSLGSDPANPLYLILKSKIFRHLGEDENADKWAEACRKTCSLEECCGLSDSQIIKR